MLPEEGNFRNDEVGTTTGTTEQNSCMGNALKISTRHNGHTTLGWNGRKTATFAQQLILTFQAASVSDKDHGPEDEDIAEWDLNIGSAIASTSVDHTPLHAIQIPQSYEGVMTSTHAQEWRQTIETELHSLREYQIVDNIEEGSIPNSEVIEMSWILAVKPDEGFKARLVVQDFGTS